MKMKIQMIIIRWVMWKRNGKNLWLFTSEDQRNVMPGYLLYMHQEIVGLTKNLVMPVNRSQHGTSGGNG